jgi:2-keto-3-deoxy-L-rhamnonate aldolase RhmA
MQIESLSAIMRAREMAELGADVLSWGPNDLTFNRESHPDHPLKTDDDCIKQVITSLQGTETTLCLRTYGEEQIAKYSEFGATMFLDESNLFKAIK